MHHHRLYAARVAFVDTTFTWMLANSLLTSFFGGLSTVLAKFWHCHCLQYIEIQFSAVCTFFLPFFLTMAHTIVMFQPDNKLETRTYWDFESLNDALECKSISFKTYLSCKLFFLDICHMYEQILKEDNPNLTTITYDVSQLFDYIDRLTDLSCLV